MFTSECVLHHHWHVCCISRLAGSGPDAVKDEIHAAESRDAIDQLDTTKLFGVEERELFLIELVVIEN